MTGSAPPPITIHVCHEDWADPAIPLPEYHSVGAAGADLRANLPTELRETGLLLAPMARALCPVGIRVEIPPGYEMQVRPRSGLALKHGVTVPNTPGTIDWDYRGPLGVPLINFGDTPYIVSHGERIAQAVIAPVIHAQYVIAAMLGTTGRGGRGFGSTGTA